MSFLIGGRPAGGMTEVKKDVTTAKTGAVAQAGGDTEQAKIEMLIARLGGIEAVEAAATAMMEATRLSLLKSKEDKKYAAFVKNLKAVATELQIQGDTTTLNGVTKAIVVDRKVTSPTSIDDKEKLYHYLESIKPGLYFHLSSIAIGDLKDHVPDAAYSQAGCSVGRTESFSVSAKVKA